ncbi:MAG: prepilin-type N-terminal cleavage/methylation domain-containing protein [Chitinispirillia bacterium]|nr:prepilin-type N-terminal cleavage/methylation domain-containing protein [Chitinispirillia bacterium]
MKKTLPSASGFTIVELMIAIFILSIVVYSLFSGLYTGDRIKGRANATRAASILASNEAERIRSEALQGIEPRELTYMETVSGITFTVYRKKNYNLDADIENKNVTEIEISVEPQSKFFSTYKFKLLQGFHQ